MDYPRPLVEGRFLARRKRFLVDVRMPDGQQIVAHLANTGKMTACTAPRAPVRLFDSADPGRKLRWSVEQIRVGGHWILVNSARPNAVVGEAILAGGVPELGEVVALERERMLGESRIDFRVTGRGVAWVEVKNVTLLEGSCLRFPDTKTARGTRHIHALRQAARAGERAVLLLHAGHEGGETISPADHLDPVWAAALRSAVEEGVEVLGYRCRMSVRGLWLGDRVPVVLAPPN